MAGTKRLAHLDDLYKGSSVFLFGGAPTIKGLPLGRLAERGVLSAAMNNTAVHFRPQLWFSGDNPKCYSMSIFRDPAILKFAPVWHMTAQVAGIDYSLYPSMVFYVPDAGIPLAEMLKPNKHTPFYANTMTTAMAILYFLGCRRIILCGCDFEGEGDVLYAHDTSLTPDERNANQRLYSSQVETLTRLKPVFVEAGLHVMDASVKSKLKDTYETLSFEEAVDLCVSEVVVPEHTSALPHGSKFGSDELKKLAGVYSAPAKTVI
jgi:hypothetical protein